MCKLCNFLHLSELLRAAAAAACCVGDVRGAAGVDASGCTGAYRGHALAPLRI